MGAEDSAAVAEEAGTKVVLLALADIAFVQNVEKNKLIVQVKNAPQSNVQSVGTR